MPTQHQSSKTVYTIHTGRLYSSSSTSTSTSLLVRPVPFHNFSAKLYETHPFHSTSPAMTQQQQRSGRRSSIRNVGTSSSSHSEQNLYIVKHGTRRGGRGELSFHLNRTTSTSSQPHKPNKPPTATETQPASQQPHSPNHPLTNESTKAQPQLYEPEVDGGGARAELYISNCNPNRRTGEDKYRYHPANPFPFHIHTKPILSLAM